MTNDKPSMSAMHQRFQMFRVETAGPDAPPAASFEAELIDLLRRPVPPGQARDGHAMKEREIGELFSRLGVLEAMALHRRLKCKAAGDELVAAFARLVEDRRARLLAFLGDARRRAAMR
jgi:hypothetical protein